MRWLVLALVITGCVSEKDRLGERAVRTLMANEYEMLAPVKQTCEWNGSTAGDGIAQACLTQLESEERILRLESMYLEVCRRCAGPDRCEAGVRRIRELRGRADQETACP